MSDSIFENLDLKRKGLKVKKSISYCAVCDTRLSPGAFFCPECDPPLPPGEEPEESGISLVQALLRIGILVILFMAIAFGKMNISFDYLFTGNKIRGQLETLAEDQQPKDKDFQLIHMVIARLANIRSKPSIDGDIIMVVERGTSLEIIKSNEHWSNVRVLGKKGWISTKLFKSEIQSPD